MKSNTKHETRNSKQIANIQEPDPFLLFRQFMLFSDFGFRISSLKYVLTVLVFTLLLSNAFAYERIISLIPSVTRSIYLLGLQDNLTAVTIYCPPEAAGKQKIGNVLDPDIEKIISLKPGLVIASKEGNRPETVYKLEKAGIKTYVMGPADSFEQICAEFQKLGRFLDREKQADKVVASCRKRIERLAKRVKGKKPVTLFWEVNAAPIFTAGKNSFVNDYIEFAGGRNIFGGLDSRFPQVSREEVVRLDPDAIILVTMGNLTADEKEAWKKYASMKAVRNGSIYVVNETEFSDPTPVSVTGCAEKLYKILHEKELE